MPANKKWPSRDASPLLHREMAVFKGSTRSPLVPERGKEMVDRKREYTTISIPRELYRRVEQIIEGTGFRSPTEYIVFLLRQAVLAIEADRQLIHSLPYVAPEPPGEVEEGTGES